MSKIIRKLFDIIRETRDLEETDIILTDLFKQITDLANPECDCKFYKKNAVFAYNNNLANLLTFILNKSNLLLAYIINIIETNNIELFEKIFYDIDEDKFIIVVLKLNRFYKNVNLNDFLERLNDNLKEYISELLNDTVTV